MVDFGSARVRTIGELFSRIFRPGDIWTRIPEAAAANRTPTPSVPVRRSWKCKKGILVINGARQLSLACGRAVDESGVLPGHDLHRLAHAQHECGLKDMMNVMSKFLALGMTVEQVVTANTLNAAKAIKQEQLGNLSV